MDNESKKKTTSTTKKSTTKKNTGVKKTNQASKKTSTQTKKTTSTKKTVSTPKTTNNKKTTSPKTTPPKQIEQTPKINITENKKDITKEEKLDSKMILIVVLAFLIAIIALAKIAGIFEIKDYSKSYLLKHKVVTNEVTTNNINNALTNKNAFILVTTLNNEEEYNLEKDLKKVIKNNELKDNFYVYIYNEDSKTNLNNIFKVTGDITLPTILYYKNGEFVDMVKREDPKMIEAADFVKLLDMYELSKEE